MNVLIIIMYIISHSTTKSNEKPKLEIPPTNISATVKFITKYMARVRRLLFFIKIMIVRRLTVTVTTPSIRNTANQMMHSDEEIIADCFLFAFNRLTSVSFCLSTFRKKMLEG